jgi:hypothetical protein
MNQPLNINHSISTTQHQSLNINHSMNEWINHSMHQSLYQWIIRIMPYTSRHCQTGYISTEWNLSQVPTLAKVVCRLLPTHLLSISFVYAVTQRYLRPPILVVLSAMKCSSYFLTLFVLYLPAVFACSSWCVCYTDINKNCRIGGNGVDCSIVCSGINKDNGGCKPAAFFIYPKCWYVVSTREIQRLSLTF